MFSSTARLVSSIAAITLALSVPARADSGVRLTTVAAENGFTYQWIPTEAGAMLSRPGVRVVIRAGRLFYEVNNATPVADSAPRFDGRDLIISQKLATHLRQIALKYPDTSLEGVTGATTGDEGPDPSAQPSSLTLHMRVIPGREAIALEGIGPAASTLIVTLSGEISTDLPIVTLSKKTITTANDGKFFAEVPYGQDSHVGTALVATVATSSGVSSAQARVVIGGVSPQIKSSTLDDWPKK